MLGRAVESVRRESGPAAVAFDALSPHWIGRRVKTEFFTNNPGELIRMLAFVKEVSALWV